MRNRFPVLDGLKFFYSDEETGIGWNIEVFETFRAAERDSVVLILTDWIRVELDRLDLMMDFSSIVDKILKGYGKLIANLEYRYVKE